MTGPYRTTLTGPFPRPETLVQATRDLDRGRIAPAQAEAEFGAAENSVREVEKALGVDSWTGGYVRWQDPFRPFTERWAGVRSGPLTRFFETNTFFRQPVLSSAPAPGRVPFAPWLPHGPGARWILPGPYTFGALADVQYPSDGAVGAMRDIATALAAELTTLSAAPGTQIQFQEPMLVYAPPTDFGGVTEAYRRLAEAAHGTPISVWTYFGDAGPVLPSLAHLPVQGVGFDLFATRLPSGVALGGRSVGLGCVDPTVTIPEDSAEIVRKVRAAEQALGARELWLGPNPPLDLLPFATAVDKLQILPQLREALAR